ncbi:hypothetical protein Q8F55_008450 [Vanrija albida]|uniref:Cleavage/polyadenylation specificity factor A subunit N-terminal domain-containing protein n=1 Tax=Vanrija albida TaxID=181172 RepID=A0ABR3PR19_9TREE
MPADTAARWAHLRPQRADLLATPTAPRSAITSGLVFTPLPLTAPTLTVRVYDVGAGAGTHRDVRTSIPAAGVRALAASRADGLLAVLEAVGGSEVAVRVHLLDLAGAAHPAAAAPVLEARVRVPDAEGLEYTLHHAQGAVQAHISASETGLASPLWAWRPGLLSTPGLAAGGFDAAGVYRPTPAAVRPLSATSFVATFQPAHDGTGEGYAAACADELELVIDAVAVLSLHVPERPGWLSYPDLNAQQQLRVTLFDDQPDFRLAPHVSGGMLVLEGNMGVTHHVGVLPLASIPSQHEPATLDDVPGVEWVSLPGCAGAAGVSAPRVAVCCSDEAGHTLYVGDYGPGAGADAAPPPPVPLVLGALPGFKVGPSAQGLVPLPDNGDPLRAYASRYSCRSAWVRAHIDWGADDVDVDWVELDDAAVYLGTTLGIVVLSF